MYTDAIIHIYQLKQNKLGDYNMKTKMLIELFKLIESNSYNLKPLENTNVDTYPKYPNFLGRGSLYLNGLTVVDKDIDSKVFPKNLTVGEELTLEGMTGTISQEVADAFLASLVQCPNANILDSTEQESFLKKLIKKIRRKSCNKKTLNN